MAADFHVRASSFAQFALDGEARDNLLEKTTSEDYRKELKLETDYCISHIIGAR